MWRWYVEVAFLVLLCFALGAGVAALVMARVLPRASDRPVAAPDADHSRPGSAS